MENIKVTGTDRHPEINFDFTANKFSIGGYSYPENVEDCYGAIIQQLINHLEALEGESINFEFAFKYFHSSTAQVLYRIFDNIEKCSTKDNSITVTWCYETDDEAMQEAGDDMAEEAKHANFIMKEVDSF